MDEKVTDEETLEALMLTKLEAKQKELEAEFEEINKQHRKLIRFYLAVGFGAFVVLVIMALVGW